MFLFGYESLNEKTPGKDINQHKYLYLLCDILSSVTSESSLRDGPKESLCFRASELTDPFQKGGECWGLVLNVDWTEKQSDNSIGK